MGQGTGPGQKLLKLEKLMSKELSKLVTFGANECDSSLARKPDIGSRPEDGSHLKKALGSLPRLAACTVKTGPQITDK